MTLVELTSIPTFDLPIAALREHLRLGTGFADDAMQDPVLEGALRGAIAAIEGRTGKVLFERGFRWTVSAWRSREVQEMPVAPVTGILSITTETRHGDSTAIDLDTVVLRRDAHRPQLRAVGSYLPVIPTHGTAQVSFTAGYSPDWTGLPADLGQALMLLAAYYYEIRHETVGVDGNMPFGVVSLIERYRTVRVLGGAQA